MTCRSFVGLEALLGAVMLLLTASLGVAAEPQPTSGAPSLNYDRQGIQDVPKQPAPAPESDVQRGKDAPKTSVDPLSNKTDVQQGNEAPRIRIAPLQNKADITGGDEVPRQDDGNHHLPGRQPGFVPSSPAPTPQAVPQPAPPRSQPGTQPRSSPPVSPGPPLQVGQAPRRRQAPANALWRGPRYTNAYGTWSPPRVTGSYGSGTGRAGPDGQRFNIVSPGYGPSSGGYASSPSGNSYSASAPPSSYGAPQPTNRFGYDETPGKQGYPRVQPAKGVLMKLGIDPGTYKSDDVPARLLDRIRLGS
jgi:hypothetical protein